jgi:N-acetylneuraminic acid mutarotase
VVGLEAIRVLITAVAALTVGAAGWQTHAPMPLPRSEVAATVLRGEIVVAGGYLADGATSAAVAAYSPTTDRWRTLPDLPVAVNHGMAAAYRGRLYVVGGYVADGSPQRNAFVLEGGGWSRLASMPEARAAAGAAVVAGRLYVAGGVAPAAGGGRRLATRMQILDLRSGRWTTTRGPTPREHLAVTALRGRVYVLAGRLGGLDTNLALLEAYTPGEGWKRLPRIPSTRGGTSAAAIAGRIVSVGGEQPTGTIASVYAYDVARGRWNRLPDLPNPRHGLGVVAVAGRVYAVAGGPEPGLTASGVNESLALP